MRAIVCERAQNYLEQGLFDLYVPFFCHGTLPEDAAFIGSEKPHECCKITLEYGYYFSSHIRKGKSLENMNQLNSKKFFSPI